MPFFGQSRGRGLGKTRPRVLKTGDKMGLPWDAYYVLTKANARLTNSKIHPNSGAPDYDIEHNVSDLNPADANLDMNGNDILNVDVLQGVAASNLDIKSFGTLSFYASGALNISCNLNDAAFNANLFPFFDNTRDLGKSDTRWRNAYILGNLSDGTFSLTVANAWLAYWHVTSTGTNHTYIDQDVTTSAGPSFDTLTITDPTVAWKFTKTLIDVGTNTQLGLQSQTSGAATRFGLFSKDGDGTDNVFLHIWGAGTPTDATGQHRMSLGWAKTPQKYRLTPEKDFEFTNSAGTIYEISNTTGDTVFSLGNLTVTNAAKEIAQVNCKMTTIGGFAISLTNRTGANTVQGQLVKADTAGDEGAILTGGADDECIGVFLDNGTPDDSSAWIVVAGIANVLFNDNTAAVRGNWVGTGTAGLARTQASPPALGIASHFEEIGHCIQNVDAGGGGTFILARCVLHFN